MAIVLLITTDNEQVIELPVFKKCTVGRSSSCDLQLEDMQISGRHGFFELNANGELVYTDLGSTNGSYLNNSQVDKIRFRINETLRLGNTNILIDEKRLNGKERLAIGRGISNGNDKLLGKNLKLDIDDNKKTITKIRPPLK
ncbi:MAG: FHA domain-containing protein [Bacteriovorax sp.]|nr:FHA domain-containing protein [Bacteriovorax sp.]